MQQLDLPCGNMAEEKTYFFGEHKQYSYKAWLVVIRIELRIGCAQHYFRSVSALKIFRQNSGYHGGASKLF